MSMSFLDRRYEEPVSPEFLMLLFLYDETPFLLRNTDSGPAIYIYPADCHQPITKGQIRCMATIKWTYGSLIEHWNWSRHLSS
jgi:hypothetical protein